MVSVTDLNSYVYCKRKLFLKGVLGFFEPPNEATVKGQIRHQVYGEINNVEEELIKTIEGLNFEDIFGAYKKKHASILRRSIIKNKNQLKNFNLDIEDVFNEFLPLILEESRVRAENVFNFIQESKVFGEELWEKLTPKIKSELKIKSKRLNLVGIIDKLEIYEDRVVPFELKTGSTPKEGVWPDHRMQLAAYCMLLEENFSLKVSEGFVHYLDGQEKRKVVLNPFLKAEIVQLTNDVLSLLNQRELPDFTKNGNKCNKCSLKEACFNEKLVNKRLKEVLTVQ